MPTLNRFKITNFRGIQSATINIDQKKKADVVTLIGLNESGKTTVLEALSHFSTGDRTIANLLAATERKEHLLSLIPIEKRAAFTGSVSIAAEIGFSDREFEKYVHDAEKHFKIEIHLPSPIKTINVSKEYKFQDSNFVSTVNYWNGINFETRKTKTAKFKRYVSHKDESENVWLYIVNTIEKDLFEIIYFPTFIVNMPSRIYLDKYHDEDPINLYYRKVIGDVVKSIGDGLELDKHVLQRLKAARERINSPNWFSEFSSSPDRKVVEAVFQRIQQVINREVIGSWARVFKHPVNSRSVKIEWGVDHALNDMPYLSFGIDDGQTIFSLNERSLGFRWFFSYLLFTQFRSKTGRKTIFLFDEPAANLHAKAQMQLMDSIARIIKGGNKVIYSTHSPHMINPLWLSDAMIVENAALDLENGDDIFGQDTRDTNIRVTGYGTFVSKFPDKSTYFQPVWEKLLYEAPPIVGVGPFLCVEGISDFHFLSYVRSQIPTSYTFNLVPGVGAGGFSDTLPSLYGTGANFALLLDADIKGEAEKKRYIDTGLIAAARVFTLADVSTDFVKKKLEDLLGEPTLAKIRDRFDGKSSKKHAGMYLAEAAASANHGMLDEATIARGKAVLDWAEVLFSGLGATAAD